jgi:hypothetical protein
MQHLIVSGKLPCSKDECAMLAALQLRIYELNYIRLMEEEEEKLIKIKAKKSRDSSTITTTSNNHRRRLFSNIVSSVCSNQIPAPGEEEPGVAKMSLVPVASTVRSVSHPNAIEEVDEEATDKQQALTATALTTTTKTTTTTHIEIIKKEPSDAKTESVDLTSQARRNTSIVSAITHLNMPVLASNGCESIFIYLKSCACFSLHSTSRILTLNKLVSSNYQRSNDIMKLIKVMIFSCYY